MWYVPPTLVLRLGLQWAVWGGVWVKKAEFQECLSQVSGFSWSWTSYQESKARQQFLHVSSCPAAFHHEVKQHKALACMITWTFSFPNHDPNKTLLDKLPSLMSADRATEMEKDTLSGLISKACKSIPCNKSLHIYLPLFLLLWLNPD